MKLRQKVGLTRIAVILFWMLVEILVVWNVGGFATESKIEYLSKLAIIFLAFFALIQLSVKLIQHIKYIRVKHYAKNI